MSKISEALKTIADPANIYGKDIRKAIHDGIEACYDDVTSPALNSEAFKAAVQSKIDDGSIAAMTIREKSLTGDKLADETITKDKLGEDVQAEFSSLKEDLVNLNINLINEDNIDEKKQISDYGDHSDYNADAYYCTGRIKLLCGITYALKYATPISARFVIRSTKKKNVFMYAALPGYANIKNGYLYLTIPNSEYDDETYVDVDFTGLRKEKDTAFFAALTANDERLENLANVNKESINKIRESISLPDYDTIRCIGDSQTGGSGGFTPWPTILHDTYLPEKNIVNHGNGGENVNAISYRCGTLGLSIKPFTLPADTSQVAVESYLTNGKNKGNLFSSWNGSNPVTVDGIRCYMRTNGTIGRVDPSSEEVVFERGVYAIPPTPVEKNNLYIFLMGQNGGFDDVEEYLNDCYKCVSKSSKYIIMMPYTESFLTKVKVTYDELLSKACSMFGDSVFDIKKYLIEYGLADNNLTATDTDTQDISDNHVPHQLYSDYDVHLNQYGLISQARGVYLFGKYNGYWN